MELKVHVSEAVDLTGFMYVIHNSGRKEDEELVERMLKHDPAEQKLDQIRQRLSAAEHERLEVFMNEDSAIVPALLPILLEGEPELSASAFSEKLRKLDNNVIRSSMFSRAFTDTTYDGTDIDQGKRLVEQLAVPAKEKWKLFYYLDRPEALKDELAALIDEMYATYYEPIREEALAAAAAYRAELLEQPNDPEHPVRRLVADYVDVDNVDVIHVYPSFSLNIGFMLADVSKERTVHFSIGIQRFSLMESKLNEEELFGLLKVLTDERRFRLLRLLKKRPHYGYELAEALGVSNSTISHHLAILLSHQFVTSDRAENRVYYKVNTAEIKRVMAQVERMFAQ
ncbi:ArsR/SmtB family transcription factor [Alkalicoccus luteus]|uniref:ArsR/SmtB family transcription factor n=1 Tax=Alkalicoccus luteus TaxID=1237094 RepID=UPI004033DD1A